MSNPATLFSRESPNIVSLPLWNLDLLRPVELVPELPDDRPGNEALDRAAEAGYLADHVRAEERIVDAGHHEERLNVRGQAPVHQGHLELIFDVRDGPQTPE